jgi:hypothetical protein
MNRIPKAAASKAGTLLRDFLAKLEVNVAEMADFALLPHRAAHHTLASFMLLCCHQWHGFSYHKEGGT